MPPRIASSALFKSSGFQEGWMAENGDESLMPSFLAILYNVELGIPNSFDALQLQKSSVPLEKTSTTKAFHKNINNK